MTLRQRRARSGRRRLAPGGRAAAAGGGLITGAVLLSGSAAQAITPPKVTVNTLSDPATPSSTIQAHESLADAIAYIDSTSSGGEIVFKSGLSGTIHLTHALPLITKAANIEGPGPAKLTIDGGGGTVNESVLRVGAGISSDTVIYGLTLTDGHATKGGAVNAQSPLFIYNDVFTHNTASLFGGAVYATNGGALVINSTISGNRGGSGSAVINFPGTVSNAQLFVEGSTVSGNTATTGYGAVDAITTLLVTSSTITGNTSAKKGAGVYGAHGAAIRNSTIVGNHTKTGGGGGIWMQTGSGTLNLTSSIVADNSAPSDPDIYNAATSSNIQYSLIGDSVDTHTPLTLYSTDIVGTAAKRAQPKLGKLADNGGPTKTRMPRTGSPVIDRGKAVTGGVDQRGYGRPVDIPGVRNSPHGDGADIGAVEVQDAGRAVSTTKGNLKLRMALPFSSCVSNFDNLPLSFTSTSHKQHKQKHRHKGRKGSKHTAPVYRFKSVSFFIDLGTTSSGTPAARSTHAKVSPRISLGGHGHGEHTLTARVTVTHRVTRHHHKHTITGKMTLRLPFNICAVSLIN